MGNRWGNSRYSVRLFGGLQNHCRWWLQPWSLKTLTPWKESYDQTRQHIMEKAMATQSSTLAWKIPWMEEPGRLQSMGSLRLGHDWVTSLSLFTFMHWSRKWQPTPVFLPGESLGWGSLVGCCLWGCTESDTTEATQQQQQPLKNWVLERCSPPPPKRRTWLSCIDA